MDLESFEENSQVQKMLEVLGRKLESRGLTYASDEDLIDEIYSAILAVNSRRRFIPTSNKLFEEQYTGLILRLCVTSIAKWGAEGEQRHSENGIGRSYEKGSEYPESMLSEVVPLGKAGK